MSERDGASPPSLAPVVGWALSMPVAFGIAVGPFAERGKEVGRAVAEAHDIQPELGLAFGAVVTMVVAASLVQLVGIGLGQLVARRRGSAPVEAASVRRDVAVGWLYASHLFPLSTMFLPGLAMLRRLRARVADRSPAAAGALRGLYYGVVAVVLFALYHWAPFFADGEGIAIAAFGLGLAAALRAWPERRRDVLLVASAIAAAAFVLAPPQQAPWALRIATAAALGATLAVPALLAGRGGARELGVLGPGIGATMIVVWCWWGVFLLYPSPGLADRLAADPAVRVEYRNGDGGPFTDNRFLVEACRPGRLLYGSRETHRGISLLGPDGRPERALPVHTGYDLARDCARGIGYVGSYETGRIERIRLDPLERLDPVPGVRISAPTLLQLSEDGRRLYATDDDDGTFHRIRLDEGRIDASVGECIPNGLFVDERHGRVHLPSCGDLVIYDLADLDHAGASGERAGVAPLAVVDLRRKPTPPFPMGAKFLRVAGDPRSGRAWATYMEMGRIYRVDGPSGRLEAEREIGRGVRDVAYDPRNDLVYVGNYITGELLAVDPDSLEVLGRKHVGRRIRGIAPTMDGERVLVTSAVGGLSVEVAGLRDERSAGR